MINHFENHAMRRETGWTWICRKPGTGIYGFRITFAPGSLMISGDIGDLIVNHYSFTDPWNAAAWVNGAEWDYFMGKAAAKKEYDRDETAQHIVSHAYEHLRMGDRHGMKLMERIVDHFGGSLEGDHETPSGRKYACREMLSCGVDQDEAYDITHDPEDLIYRYPAYHRICYDAAKWWAKRMWETEPAWHKVVRFGRRIRNEWRDLKRFPIIYGPIRYAMYDKNGRLVYFNGATYWQWVEHPSGKRVYQALSPFRVMGLDMTGLGFWRLQGSSWPDDQLTDQWGRPTNESRFRDVR